MSRLNPELNMAWLKRMFIEAAEKVAEGIDAVVAGRELKRNVRRLNRLRNDAQDVTKLAGDTKRAGDTELATLFIGREDAGPVLKGEAESSDQLRVSANPTTSPANTVQSPGRLDTTKERVDQEVDKLASRLDRADGSLGH